MKQGHQARLLADGRVVIAPAPKKKEAPGEATMGKVLTKLKMVYPMMKALEL